MATNHGSERAETGSYSLHEATSEYHILRHVLCDTLEEESPLMPREREIIMSAIEKAVRDMASQFAKSAMESHNLFVLTLNLLTAGESAWL